MSATCERKTYKINVRALADFCQTEGDLISQYRASPSSLEGQFGHRAIQNKRPKPYQPEVSVSVQWQAPHFDLRVSGRVDGVFHSGIEEIKTTRIPPSEIPPTTKALNLSQAKIYAAILANQSFDNRKSIDVCVCYVHPQTLQEWPETQTFQKQDLIDYLVLCCARYEDWLEQKHSHFKALIPYLDSLAFPYSAMRQEQRLMAESAYKSILTQKHLCVEAPTGTGKTLASLFPAIKALKTPVIDSVFYLSMKNTGQVAAWDSLKQLDPSARINAIQLSSKDSACLSPETPCDGEFCEFARGYFRKRSQIRHLFFSHKHWTKAALMEIGLENEICPYYLSQDWAIWSDIVVGDINYIYDTTAVQPYLLKEIDNRATILIDEAHNLIERGRMIYSTEFLGASLQALLKLCPSNIKKNLAKIQSALRTCCKDKQQEITSISPESLIGQARQFVSDSAALLRESPSFVPPIEWQQFIFMCSRFVRLSELANEQDFVWRYNDGQPADRKIELLCLNPATLLAQKHNIVNNVIAFSATLTPANYSLTLNGLSESVYQQLPSPFSPQQHRVKIVRDVSTRYTDRNELPQTIKNLLQSYSLNEKNTFVFFSSYLQLKSCTAVLEINENKCIIQQRSWTQEDKNAVINRFKNEQGLSLFCVLGGVYSEGVDLPNAQLEQVIIVGPGLPQVNDLNNRIKMALSQRGMPGFDYTYLFPGLQKVLQAAGRAVRTENDIGDIVLIDDRFIQYWKNGLLPSYWHIEDCSIAKWTSHQSDSD
ncbi:helicase C-terminal domain-containing protein [Reinekea marina]|uniref:DNA 5'-3' helicase n=1 Tax=Reinekea marina TaxID=1310421 RepID=A0ABV7WT30_9GAMM|nr:helicase C-terminal domain-containing protein [Reinekea marina]MDN3650664.1 helicase C-terminal domain-containing protein [Reinekea marina]